MPPEEIISGGDRRKPGPLTDRIFMRLKDAVILGAAGIALFKWFYVNPIQIQERVTRGEALQVQQQQTLEKIASSLEIQTDKLGDIEKRFADFQRSFYAKKPGGWVFEDDHWEWDQAEGVRHGKN